ncbi:cilia- and flagella-associated protein 97-like isoform X2 [Galleria mellonella]|nr:cilia- and flagella-associated protein 97-like isoform X2 [Galleria mellonella]XP_026751699.2 cilia- and flagella-associated protein 97-like isoform X2 [Galleria mellonella]XP_031764954.2 cilia- and flagella-associated protein 97-like isoform X2 [Galleria mellonella]XP_031764955.2 cilia- and flagella-associated protein 97-like isoform X2 [Galleria mellonella]XP_031764956.2 cilia- and flagella-associated protein 97-like isoform X2 [Galleria mellonella]XP_052749965.1 cilia- and flagella-assoc
MSHRDNKLDNGYIDTEFSSGDSNRNKTKQCYREENNNEVDELSKELSEMGCIVDAVKRPPNICVETCVYDSGSEHEKSKSYNNDDDAYSDEFEDDKSDEEESIKTELKSLKSDSGSASKEFSQSSVKLSKSHSSMSSKPPASITSRSNYGSVSVPPTKRINMSFTNDRLREIERHNHILLTKILSARNTRKSSIPPREQPARKAMPPAAVSRKKQQRQIDYDNMILLKKIQRAKSSACSIRR